MTPIAPTALPTYDDAVAAASRVAGVVRDQLRSQRAGMIISGGNVDFVRLGALLAG